MNYRKWIQLLLINFLVLACLGLLMRYKIAFSFSYLEQKHIQHAHSHFTFVAWISQALYIFLIHFLEQRRSIDIKKYEFILLSNTILSFAMLISFLLKGYHLSSNAFSFLIILNSIYFTYQFIRDSWFIKVKDVSITWFYGALFFNFISMFGTFFLVYLILKGNFKQDTQLASVYYYLHFQYNGWFLLTCIGLYLNQISKYINSKRSKIIFWMFFLSTVPNYFLSIMWWNISTTLYVFVICSAIINLISGILLLVPLAKLNKEFKQFSRYKILIYILVICFVLKLVLQTASVIPYLSHLAYSLRSVIIAYLHLVLLVVISTFILNYIYVDVLKLKHPRVLYLFLLFVLFNEFLLGLQSVCGVFYINLSSINYWLLGASLGIVYSIIRLNKTV